MPPQHASGAAVRQDSGVISGATPHHLGGHRTSEACGAVRSRSREAVQGLPPPEPPLTPSPWFGIPAPCACLLPCPSPLPPPPPPSPACLVYFAPHLRAVSLGGGERDSMAPHARPKFVLFGASMTEFSFCDGGWGAALANLYCRKVYPHFASFEPPGVRGPPFLATFPRPILVGCGWGGWSAEKQDHCERWFWSIVHVAWVISLGRWLWTCRCVVDNQVALAKLVLETLGFEELRLAMVRILMVVTKDIVLRGYRGWNTRRALEALDKIFPKDAEDQPELVVVFIGANDAAFPMPSGRGQYVPLPEFEDNLCRIATHLQGLSDKTRVILTTAPPVYEAARLEHGRRINGEKGSKYLDRSNKRAGQYAAACRAAAQRTGAGYIDLWTLIQRQPDWQTTYLTDGMHLSALGSAVMLEELLKVLKDSTWQPSLHYDTMSEDLTEPSIYDTIHPSEEDVEIARVLP